jgi:hypothetical protein
MQFMGLLMRLTHQMMSRFFLLRDSTGTFFKTSQKAAAAGDKVAPFL